MEMGPASHSFIRVSLTAYSFSKHLLGRPLGTPWTVPGNPRAFLRSWWEQSRPAGPALGGGTLSTWWGWPGPGVREGSPAEVALNLPLEDELDLASRVGTGRGHSSQVWRESWPPHIHALQSQPPVAQSETFSG